MVSAPDIPGHKVEGILGSGGYATVYRAWQVAVGREVAVKVDNRVLLSERDRRRFHREVTAAGRLSGHPHVIDLYDAGTLADGRPYLVMELCPAGSLSDALRRHGPMSPARVRDIGIRLADALAAAHAAGVLHRDIKPANILVNRYGMVGISDFGLASIIAATGDQTASREALTPAYASPESFRGEEPTAAADIYSLTATLYALLAGRPPRFPADGRSPTPAMIMMLHDQPLDDVPGTPPEFMALLRRGLASDQAARPHSAVALRDALVHLARSPAAPARPGAAPAAEPGPHARAAPVHPADATTPRVSGPAIPGAGAAASDAGAAAPGSRPSGRRAGHLEGSAPGGPPPGGPPRGSPGRHTGRRTAPHPRRGMLRPIALAAAVVVIAGVGALLGTRFLGHGGGHGARAGSPSRPGHATAPAGGAPGVFGIPTVTKGCPAASVRVATARCPAAPECWAGMVVISGSASARSIPCSQPHTWETFAIAILPADARTFDQVTLEHNPTVGAVCSMRVLLRSRQGRALRTLPRAWTADVLPPDEAAFNSGARAYRCVADLIGRHPHTSLFRR